MRLRPFVFGLPLLTIIVLMIFWRGMYAQSSNDAKSFPTINLPILFDSEKRFQEQDLVGSISLVNFWASWCAACQEEHSVLLWIHKNYPALKLDGINFQDNVSEAKAMLMRYGNPYSLVIEDSEGTSAYTVGVDVLPQTFLIDKKGKIRYHHRGVITKRLFESTILPIVQKIEKE